VEVVTKAGLPPVLCNHFSLLPFDCARFILKEEEFEEANGVFRIRKWKYRQHIRAGIMRRGHKEVRRI
jgi:hypothetical protein